ncbi:MAG: hypothetical protein JNL21_20250 [Myxococcales bacterium]|nr:hypothetical protein [Myxococcales bacterium]
MPSLLKQLLDTLPFAGLAGRVFVVDGTAIDATEVNTVARFLTFLEGGDATSIEVDASRPSAEELATYERGDVEAGDRTQVDTPEGEEPERVTPAELSANHAEKVPIWSYKTAAEPHRFVDIACRSRGEDYDKYLVMSQVAWGLEGPQGLEPAVRVNFLGSEITLPLTPAARLMTFRVKAGRNIETLHPQWPLAARHDDSVMHVFAYDVHPATLSKIALSDPNHPDARKVSDMLALCRTAFGPRRNESPDGTMASHIFIDDLWPDAIEATAPLFGIGDYVTLIAKPVRILIAVSLTGCRENWRYTPGAASGMGRLYPQLFVKCHGPLNRIEAVLHVDRPAQTTVLDGHRCHCDEMKSAIGSFLATDANHGMEVIVGSPPLEVAQPFWSNLFAYYFSNLYDKHGSLLMNVVRNDRRKERTKLDLLFRRPVKLVGLELWAGDAEKERGRRVRKVPRQGAFDNIHLAPRMRLKHGPNLKVVSKHSTSGSDSDIGKPSYRVSQSIIADGWRLRDVVMAPFCAHDCFHFHWRWSDTSTDMWTYGWGPLGPYTVSGAAMVPPNQEVDVRLRSDHQFTYLARAMNVPADLPVVFCHHGGAYALAVGLEVKLGRLALEQGLLPRYWFESDEGEHTPRTSWTAFYWALRHEVVPDGNGGVTFLERTEVYDLQALLSM